MSRKIWVKSFSTHLMVALGIVLFVFWRKSSFAPSPPIEIQITDVHVHHATPLNQKRNQGIPAPANEITQSKIPQVESQQQATSPTGEWKVAENYLQKVTALISSHQVYPKVSILNDEQGTVFLKIRLDSMGRVQKIETVQSSGFLRLDQSAMRAIEAASPLPLPEGHAGELVLSIPIRFEINPEH